MALSLEIIDPLSYPAWDEMLIRSQDYTFFHTTPWIRTLKESYKFTPYFLTAFKDTAISVLLPFMEVKDFLQRPHGIGLPFSDFCNPIIETTIDQTNLFNQIIDFGTKKQWKSLTLSGAQHFSYPLQKSSFFFGHTLKLQQNEDYLYSQFRDATKRNIQKAMKLGIRIVISQKYRDLQLFYKLHELTRKKHGIPPQPFSFFKALYKHILQENHGMLILAYYNENPIAGNLYLQVGEKALFKYGASDQRFINLLGSYLIMWEAIRYYTQNNFSEFYFGKTEPEHSGLLQFKRGWRPEEVIYNTYKYNFHKQSFIEASTNKINKKHTLLFRKTPLIVSRCIGSLFYKYFA